MFKVSGSEMSMVRRGEPWSVTWAMSKYGLSEKDIVIVINDLRAMHARSLYGYMNPNYYDPELIRGDLIWDLCPKELITVRHFLEKQSLVRRMDD